MKTPEYLLTKLIEECAEVTQRATKALTFGLTEKQPEQDLDNIARLRGELVDLLGVIDMLDAHHVCQMPDRFMLEELKLVKRDKVIKYAEYSVRQGTLNDTKLFPPGHPMHDRGEGNTTAMLKEAIKECMEGGRDCFVVMSEMAMVTYAMHLVFNLTPMTKKSTSTQGGKITLTFPNKSRMKFIGPDNMSLICDGASRSGWRMMGDDGAVFVDHALKGRLLGINPTPQKDTSK